MVKIVKLLFLILIFVTTLLSANDYKQELLEYDKKIVTSDDDELLRVHHALKSIYIQSIINNDISLKKQALQRLIKSATILKFDTVSYKKELATLDKNTPKKEIQKKKTVKKKKIVPIQKTITKAKIPPKRVAFSKHFPNLVSIVDKNEKLTLVFDKKLSSRDIKSFQLRGKKNYREVFDIKAVLSYIPNIKTPSQIDDLRIAQYNDKTLRIVFQRKSIFKSRIKVSGTKIDINYGSKINTKAKPADKYTNYVKNISPNKIIVIDAGHGGKDAGAVGSKSKYEKHVVLKLALKIGKILQQRGYKVYYTRTKDKFIRLRDRTQYANKKDADLFLSIHANASNKKSFHGVETFFLSPARSKRSKNVAALENKSDMQEMDYFSKQTFLNVFNREKIISANKLALDVQQGMLNRLKAKYSGVKDGGVREAPFWVLVGAQMPSILIEAGYISNTKERKRLFNSHYQNLIANGIADGIDSYFVKSEY